MTEKSAIARSAFSMTAATSISRILGFARDMLVARFLGAGGLSDSFFVAFRVPNLLRELFAEGSMSSGVIPVLSQYNATKGQSAAAMLVRSAFTFIAVLSGLVCLVGIFFAPQIVNIIAPGFSANPAKFTQTVLLTRIMVPFLFFVSISAIVMGALNSRKIFFVPAMASTWFNIGIISTIAALYFVLADHSMVVAIGVTVGGFFQFASQVPTFYKNEFSLRPSFNFSHPGLKQIGLLVLPAAIGTSVSQLNIFISTILASYLPTGSITYLYYAMRLIQFPVGVFGVAMGMAVLPSLSEHAARGDFDSLTKDFTFSLKLLFSITIPSMIGLISLSQPIVNVLFQHGHFDYQAMRGTTTALLYYCTGIWAMVGVRVVASTFYSMQDTKTPVRAAVFTLIINISMSVILMEHLSFAGLALANALSASANFLALFYFLNKKLKHIAIRGIVWSFMKTLLSSVLMGVAGWYLVNLRQWDSSGHFLVKSLYLTLIITVCTVVYFAAAYVLKSEEVNYIVKTFKRKIIRRTQ
ncbi:murein biosynthesis integral membrane protein MurJ [Candidatus Magnetominusculus xianensis]|nr:murein biosynthesis integral membrane protein MurJ [Candidatus Magnetominusculus xianensis]MBF0404156.1 murein biosynthesis integral membrane protein MurJ [Nitrospirota bacterium]